MERVGEPEPFDFQEYYGMPVTNSTYVNAPGFSGTFGELRNTQQVGGTRKTARKTKTTSKSKSKRKSSSNTAARKSRRLLRK
jgi:hypothetical protein